MTLKKLITKLQDLQKQGSGVNDSWPVYLYDGEIKTVKAFPSNDGLSCHITEANEIVLEFITDPGGS